MSCVKISLYTRAFFSEMSRCDQRICKKYDNFPIIIESGSLRNQKDSNFQNFHGIKTFRAKSVHEGRQIYIHARRWKIEREGATRRGIILGCETHHAISEALFIAPNKV